MLDKIQTNLQYACRLATDRSILVGVSGGPDSLVLLDALARLGYPLVVAHLDHGLRPESKAEAEAVSQQAELRGAQFIGQRVDVAAYAGQHSLSIEQAARTLRYRFLFRQAELHGAQAVAVGHTADDQVETVLMHLLRGAGMSGLQGMAFCSLPSEWSRDIPLVRPLLSVWRHEVLEYVTGHGLQPAFDPSNQDIRYTRNRLRHELIPELESYNPRLKQALWRMAEVFSQEEAVLGQVEAQAWQECLLQVGSGYLALSASRLQAQPPGVQRRVVRRALTALRPGAAEIDFEAVTQTVEFLAHPARSSRRDLAAGLSLLLEGAILWVAAWEADLPGLDWPRLNPGTELNLVIPGQMDLFGDWRLSAECNSDTEAARQQAYDNQDPFQAWLDLDRLQIPLQVRTRRPGERFHPLGLAGHSLKLADFMINVKLPQRARASWPLVCSGGLAAWVPGFQVSHGCRVTQQTERIVHIRLERVGSD